MSEDVSPVDGGCWFCHTTWPPLSFSWEFDTNVHGECVIAALVLEPEHPEARLMAKELGIWEG